MYRNDIKLSLYFYYNMTHVMHFWLIKYSLLRGDFNLTYIDPTPSKYTRQKCDYYY